MPGLVSVELALGGLRPVFVTLTPSTPSTRDMEEFCVHSILSSSRLKSKNTAIKTRSSPRLNVTVASLPAVGGTVRRKEIVVTQLALNTRNQHCRETLPNWSNTCPFQDHFTSSCPKTIGHSTQICPKLIFLDVHQVQRSSGVVRVEDICTSLHGPLVDQWSVPSSRTT